MRWSLFRANQQALQWENRFLRLALALLAAANLWAWYQHSQQETVVVLVPPTLSKPVEVARHQADAPYKIAQGLFVAQLLGNVTPGTGELLLQALDPLLDPTIYQPVRLGITEQLKKLREDQVTLSFTPQSTTYEPASDTVFITGRLTTTGVSGATRRGDRTYEVRWRLDHYRPTLIHVDAYDGPPRIGPDSRNKVAETTP